MPKLVRWFVRTSLVYFSLSLMMGAGLALRQSAGAAEIPGLFPVYIHLLVLGWISQLIMGVAVWMFPKFTQQMPRGRDYQLWACYLLLNGGLVLRALAEPFSGLYPRSIWGWGLVVSALMNILAAALFVANVWPRIKAK